MAECVSELPEKELNTNYTVDLIKDEDGEEVIKLLKKFFFKVSFSD
jgi:hypothetical protein